MRQQLAWVVGALIPVAVALDFTVGDRLLAAVALVAAMAYPIGRRSKSS